MSRGWIAAGLCGVIILGLGGCATKEMVMMSPSPPPPPPAAPPPAQMWIDTRADQEIAAETYAPIIENPLKLVSAEPVSTFSIDVDSGSYSNVRRILNQGARPPSDAVRIEELINYFDYDYAAPPSADQPFAVHTEVAAAPWNRQRQLLRIGIQGYRVPAAQVPAANLVFLIDTSGSMQDQNKLPLLKQSLRLLVKQLSARDRVSIVAYAGSAGQVLPPTPGDRRQTILSALDRLEAGGSTNGGAGIELAYTLAAEAKIESGANWVILATDGDFNVGTVSRDALEGLVASRRNSGVGLITLGFGTGNYNDAIAEHLADVGNGHYAYIDTLSEARKALVDALSTSMLTIASDVKIQVEFNPARVAEYRLIGYQNRLLRAEDFNNDRVDAGEIGAGQNVTALYEIALVGGAGTQVDPLRYQAPAAQTSAVEGLDAELAFVKLRYKRPGEAASQLISQPVLATEGTGAGSESLRFAAAVAAFGDRLRGGQIVGEFGYAQVLETAGAARGSDPFGIRGEFLQMVALAQALE